MTLGTVPDGSCNRQRCRPRIGSPVHSSFFGTFLHPIDLNSAMMLEVEDIYYRLRELGPTPEDEVCSCLPGSPIMLMSVLGRNPMHCLDCNLEVEPGTLPLPEGMVDGVAHWSWVAGAIHDLELDSGPYEQWAQTELSNLGSPINREGLVLRSQLDPVRRCYYTLFQPLAEIGFAVPEACPICEGAFTVYTPARFPFPRLICEGCSLVLVNP